MSQRLREVVATISGFDDLPHADKLRFFAWVLHAEGKEHLKAADFAACYDAIHLQQPGNLHRAITALAEQGDLLVKLPHGFRLSKPQREAHEARYGKRPVTVQIFQLLEGLPAKLSTPDQQDYLSEALRCLRVEAWRAAMLMAWCLAFDHLCEFVIANKLSEFNTVTAKWKKPVTITQRSDLQEMQEKDVVTVCRMASITDRTQTKCLERNLGIRNDAAHPSGGKFDQARAEAFVSDVVNTIILGLT